MNPDLRHPNGYTFPAGPKAPAPIAAWRAVPLQTVAGQVFQAAAPFFYLPRAIAAALQERGDK